ncbi:aminotransferase class I/II-fold pyridoxal phosphate-dependent enzyme [Synechocystis sp. FACHB-383]|uniref:aminotransferase class I/II-fold pyridoxal phosphate-dependent enzyme n=1 Tax=Synechocystis sp. FACHB-383 TaxID=2692864 RepID=UPI0016880B37|nr:aminotransferase class I/II-fold pyridoxal phosphate-dependent enzyme [Synechocystis sp. FACHB-383]MBD2653072.1 aminotransferase class I/II-fold pyridoxal phosphate-dependent enzyme [Synechocystis sp. FACHB-383]
MASLDQQDLPLANTLKNLAQQRDTPFYAPGHKRGQGIAPGFKQWLGPALFQADLPELPELDNLFAPSGAIAKAQELAADLWGAERTWFSVNGSTAGIVAAILATCGDGDKILLPRNVHQAAIAGVIHAGAVPIFLEPEVNPDWDLALGIRSETLSKALQEHGDAKAVFLLHPTYHGVVGDLQKLIELSHGVNLPVIVDEAHGAHFAFHPSLPRPALELGADIVIQSTHKMLGALSQCAMVHVQGNLINTQRIGQCLQLIQSTSPSYILLASLDSARHQMANVGREMMAEVWEFTLHYRQQLKQITGLNLLEIAQPSPGALTLDPTRITVDVTPWGMSGFELDDLLREKFQITAELPTLRQLSFIVSIGNQAQDLARLLQALTRLAPTNFQQPFHLTLPALPSTNLAMIPRRAAYNAQKLVPVNEAIGQISAGLLCPYPPGIPVLVPGEIITPEAIAFLTEVLSLGGTISGLASEELTHLAVVN